MVRFFPLRHRQLAAWSIFVAALLAQQVTVAQSEAGAATGEVPYRFSLSVNEVNLTFHAADKRGQPVNDLKLDDLRLRDNGKPAQRIIDFRLMQDFPIRAGILMDTSESMERDLPGNRAISIEYAQRILRQRTDQAFVMEFGFVSKMAQDWTSDPGTLTAGIRQITAGKENPLGGTAIFDTIFRACLYGFGKLDHAASGNFILLFSDGEDNTSHVSLADAVNQCQRSNTAIYAFRAEPDPSLYSSGPKTLAELASQTGGHVFSSSDFAAEIDADLRIIEAEMRTQYRLVYIPAQLKPDGAFHRIELRGPERVDSITVRSGYYAPKQ